MSAADRIFLGASRTPDDAWQRPEELLLKYANRHGLITGATGTGKTVTLQILAEAFSNAGVPVFAADIKGDLSGLSVPGEGGAKIDARATSVGQTWTATGFPTALHRARTSRSDRCCTTIVEVSTRSAHSRSESSNGCTFRSTSRSSHDSGNIEATVSNPNGGIGAFFPSSSNAYRNPQYDGGNSG